MQALRGVSRVTLFLLLMVFPTVAILKPRPPCSYTIFTARVKEWPGYPLVCYYCLLKQCYIDAICQSSTLPMIMSP